MKCYSQIYLIKDMYKFSLRAIPLVYIILLIGITCFAESPTSEEKFWMVQCHDGKGGKPFKVPNNYTFKDFSEYRQYLSQICYWNVRDYSKSTNDLKQAFLSKNLRLTYIGKLGEYKVYDVTNSNSKVKHKAIVLEDKNKLFHVLYLQFGLSTANTNDLPEIFTLENDSILGYETEIPGTGNHRIQHYYVLDDKSKIPKEIDFSPMREHIKNTLPDGHSIWKGGGLNFKKMTYGQVVHKDGDGNCCPSGGIIRLKLKLLEDRISVVSTDYDPSASYE